MRRIGIVLVACGALAACGGTPRGDYRVDRAVTPSYQPQALYATGSIQSACLRADRRAATRQLCGCVQAVANRTLSSSDQRMAVGFFKDPHQAQVIRQSDQPSHEIFWDRYKAFTRQAEQVCR